MVVSTIMSTPTTGMGIMVTTMLPPNMIGPSQSEPVSISRSPSPR